MKIAVATNNGVNVTGHLGRCRSFIIYEVENNDVKNRTIRENVFTHHQTHGHNHGEGHQHGEGHHGHNELIEGLRDCQTVIFNSGGWRVVEDLRSNNIQPFLTDETDADTAVRKYLKGELEERSENACRHHE